MKTKIVLRRFEDGDLIALFPDIPADYSGNIMSYMKVGQHGAASPELIHTLEVVDYASSDAIELMRHLLEDTGYE